MFELFGVALAWLAVNYVPFIICYIGGGVVYAVLKWVINLLRLGRKIRAIKTEGLTANDIGTERRSAAASLFNGYEYPPTASSNKARLFMWATFWPINLVYTLLADVSREAWDFIYRKFGAVLDFFAKKILPN